MVIFRLSGGNSFLSCIVTGRILRIFSESNCGPLFLWCLSFQAIDLEDGVVEKLSLFLDILVAYRVRKLFYLVMFECGCAQYCYIIDDCCFLEV